MGHTATDHQVRYTRAYLQQTCARQTLVHHYHLLVDSVEITENTAGASPPVYRNRAVPPGCRFKKIVRPYLRCVHCTVWFFVCRSFYIFRKHKSTVTLWRFRLLHHYPRARPCTAAPNKRKKVHCRDSLRVLQSKRCKTKVRVPS